MRPGSMATGGGRERHRRARRRGRPSRAVSGRTEGTGGLGAVRWFHSEHQLALGMSGKEWRDGAMRGTQKYREAAGGGGARRSRRSDEGAKVCGGSVGLGERDGHDGRRRGGLGSPELGRGRGVHGGHRRKGDEPESSDGLGGGGEAGGLYIGAEESSGCSQESSNSALMEVSTSSPQ